MVTFTLTADTTAISNKMKRLRVRLDEAQKEFLHDMANTIIINSPVDTGTYITSHHITEGNAGGFATTSSRGLERGQEWGPWAQKGLNILAAEIEALPMLAPLVTITNVAEHAAAVEYGGDYAPYTVARNVAQQLAQDALRRVKGA